MLSNLAPAQQPSGTLWRRCKDRPKSCNRRAATNSLRLATKTVTISQHLQRFHNKVYYDIVSSGTACIYPLSRNVENSLNN